MKYVYIVYDVPFQRLLEAADQSCENAVESVHSVICKALYIICSVEELSNSELDRRSLYVMSHFVKFFPASMELGSRGHIFFSAMKFKTCREVLVGEDVEGVVKHKKVLEAEEAGTLTTIVFEVGAKALH